LKTIVRSLRVPLMLVPDWNSQVSMMSRSVMWYLRMLLYLLLYIFWLFWPNKAQQGEVTMVANVADPGYALQLSTALPSAGLVRCFGRFMFFASTIISISFNSMPHFAAKSNLQISSRWSFVTRERGGGGRTSQKFVVSEWDS
jgi:hypothetical protein